VLELNRKQLLCVYAVLHKNEHSATGLLPIYYLQLLAIGGLHCVLPEIQCVENSYFVSSFSGVSLLILSLAFHIQTVSIDCYYFAFVLSYLFLPQPSSFFH
jgi:hypothetical protein